MKTNILLPSPQTSRTMHALSKLPPTKLSVEQVRAQVKLHLQEAREELLKHGRGERGC